MVLKINKSVDFFKFYFYFLYLHRVIGHIIVMFMRRFNAAYTMLRAVFNIRLQLTFFQDLMNLFPL